MKAQAVALFFFFPFPSLFLFLLKPKRVLSPLPPSPPRSALLPGGAEGSGAFQHGPVIQCRASIGRMKSIRSFHSLYPQRTFENGKNETSAIITLLLLFLFCFLFLVKATDLITWEGWRGPWGCTGISEGV